MSSIREQQDTCPRWQDLPAALLCHILTPIPHKRADARAVCRSWCAAVNSTLDTISVPAAHLQLVNQLPSVRHLTVKGSKVGPQQALWAPHLSGSGVAWPPSAKAIKALDGSLSQPQQPAPSNAGTKRAAVRNSDSGWILPTTVSQPGIDMKLDKLVTLRLLSCHEVLQWLANALGSSTVAGSGSTEARLPGLLHLQLLELNNVGNVTWALPALLLGQICQRQQQQHHNSLLGWQQLREVHLVRCKLHHPHRSQLQLLRQLPALQVLQLSDCGLHQVPEAVLSCCGLTQLVLSSNNFYCLPEQLGDLRLLQVLDLSSCDLLQAVGPWLSKLTMLTELNLSCTSGQWVDHSMATHQPGLLEDLDSSGTSSSSNSTSGSGSAASARAALPPLLPPVSHQQQAALLPQLSALRNLQQLNLSGNRTLMELPTSLSHLTNLTLLDVRGCGLRWLSDVFFEITSLQQLLLADNVLAELPGQISHLQQLQVLDLSGCSSLWRLPASLVTMQSLVKLMVPCRATDQHIVERLMLACGSTIEVIEDPESDHNDAEGYQYLECFDSCL